MIDLPRAHRVKIFFVSANLEAFEAVSPNSLPLILTLIKTVLKITTSLWNFTNLCPIHSSPYREWTMKVLRHFSLTLYRKHRNLAVKNFLPTEISSRKMHREQLYPTHSSSIDSVVIQELMCVISASKVKILAKYDRSTESTQSEYIFGFRKSRGVRSSFSKYSTFHTHADQNSS